MATRCILGHIEALMETTTVSTRTKHAINCFGDQLIQATVGSRSKYAIQISPIY